MWPDEGIKGSQIFPKVDQKVDHIRLYSAFLNGQKVSRYFGNYCRKNCHQDLSKRAQSGHTTVTKDDDHFNFAFSSILIFLPKLFFLLLEETFKSKVVLENSVYTSFYFLPSWPTRVWSLGGSSNLPRNGKWVQQRTLTIWDHYSAGLQFDQTKNYVVLCILRPTVRVLWVQY